MKNNTTILIFTLITLFYSNIKAKQFCACTIKTFDETINLSSGTQAITVYVVAKTLDPTITNYLERTDINNNMQTLATIAHPLSQHHQRQPHHNATTLTINLTHQPKGIYLVKISSNKENTVQKFES